MLVAKNFNSPINEASKHKMAALLNKKIFPKMLNAVTFYFTRTRSEIQRVRPNILNTGITYTV